MFKFHCKLSFCLLSFNFYSKVYISCRNGWLHSVLFCFGFFLCVLCVYLPLCNLFAVPNRQYVKFQQEGETTAMIYMLLCSCVLVLLYSCTKTFSFLGPSHHPIYFNININIHPISNIFKWILPGLIWPVPHRILHCFIPLRCGLWIGCNFFCLCWFFCHKNCTIALWIWAWAS